MFMTTRMNSATGQAISLELILVLFLIGAESRSESFRVATYNVESYLDAASPTRTAKSPESKAKVCETLLALKPDVVALEEMASLSALLDLRDSLKSNGLDLPYSHHLYAAATTINPPL